MSAFQEIASDAPLPVHAETGPAIDAPHDTLFSIPELLESARATRIHEFIKILHRLHLNIKHRDMVLALQDEDAQLVIDVIQLSLADTQVRANDALFRQALYLLVKLADRTNFLPNSLFVQEVDLPEREPCKYGGFAMIYKGRYNEQDVAIKKLCFSDENLNSSKYIKTFCREALVWRQLRHTHVLPFLGVDQVTFPTHGHMCMISPWMPKGTLHHFVTRSPDYDAEADCPRLIGEIASALLYLHSFKVIHGDIHIKNVLINGEKQAMLADFGLSIVGDKTEGRMTSTGDDAGAKRYLAPERIRPSTSNQRRNTAGDVFAFGCLCYFLYSGKQPFHGVKDVGVMLQVLDGNRPERPQGNPFLTDSMWLLIQDCWSQEQTERPSMRQVEDRLYAELAASETSSYMVSSQQDIILVRLCIPRSLRDVFSSQDLPKCDNSTVVMTYVLSMVDNETIEIHPEETDPECEPFLHALQLVLAEALESSCLDKNPSSSLPSPSTPIAMTRSVSARKSGSESDGSPLLDRYESRTVPISLTRGRTRQLGRGFSTESEHRGSQHTGTEDDWDCINRI